MAKEIYEKLSVLYLAELERLETQVNDIECILQQSAYESGLVLEYAVRKSKLDYFKKHMKDVLDYVRIFDR